MYISLFVLVVLFGGYGTDASLILSGKTQVYEDIDSLSLSCDFEKTAETNYIVIKLEIKAGLRVLAQLLNNQKISTTTLYDVTAIGRIDNQAGHSNLNATIWKIPAVQSARAFKCFALVEDASEEQQVIKSNSLIVNVLKPSPQQMSEYTWSQLRNVDKLFVMFNELRIIMNNTLKTFMKKNHNPSSVIESNANMQVTNDVSTNQKEWLEVKIIQNELKKQIANLEKNTQTLLSTQAKSNPELESLKITQNELKSQIANYAKNTQTLLSTQAKSNPEVESLKITQNELKSQIRNLEKTTQTLSSTQAKPNPELESIQITQNELKSLIANLEKTTQTLSSTQAKSNPKLESLQITQNELKSQIVNLEKTTQTLSSTQAKSNPELESLQITQNELKSQIANLQKTTQTLSSTQAKSNPELESLKITQNELKTQITNLEKTTQTLSSTQANPNPELESLKITQNELKSQIANLEKTTRGGVRIEEGSYSCGYDFKDFPKAGKDSSRVEEVIIRYKQQFDKKPFVFQSVLFQDIDVEDEVVYAIDTSDESNTGFTGMCVKYQTPAIFELQVKWFAIEVK